uniref:Uncharacterized protein n=1 Tax=Arundo donax TaxID=35708 RepID=A0A0A9A0G7_ARUDO
MKSVESNLPAPTHKIRINADRW